MFLSSENFDAHLAFFSVVHSEAVRGTNFFSEARYCYTKIKTFSM